MKEAVSRTVRIAIFNGFVLSLLFTAVATPSLSATWNLASSNYLSISEVCQHWGERPLEISAFRAAKEDETARAAMVCSLINDQNAYVGMRRSEIESLFGNFTGYHYTELHPTYLIQIAKTKGQDSWQVVFIIDHEGKVSEVVVHKNCC